MKPKFKKGDIVKVKDTKHVKKCYRKKLAEIISVMKYCKRKTYLLKRINTFYSFELEEPTDAEKLIYYTHGK